MIGDAFYEVDRDKIGRWIVYPRGQFDRAFRCNFRTKLAAMKYAALWTGVTYEAYWMYVNEVDI